MPTYDYRCNNCEHAFELFQSMKASPKRKCPECGKNTLERLIGTGAGVIFKGGGFYETDYRSDSYKKAAEADKKAAEGNSEKKGNGAGESKSDAKAEKPASEKPKKSEAPSTSGDPKPTKKKTG